MEINDEMEIQEEKERRRSEIIEKAVTEANRIILDGSDGSREETNYLTAMVAKKLMEQVLNFFSLAILKKDMEETKLIKKGKGCNHKYPERICLRDEKRGNRYFRVIYCKICGTYLEVLDPQEVSPQLIEKLDREGTVK